MSRTTSDMPAKARQVSKDSFFATPIYFTDVPDADTLNEQLTKGIRAWRKRDPEGTVRTNVAQAGAWHSATDMHTRSEFDGLTREVFAMIQGVYDELGYDGDFEPACDSMWANINPLRASVLHRSPAADADSHALLRSAA